MSSPPLLIAVVIRRATVGMLGRSAVVLRPRTAAIIANGILASRLRRKSAFSPAESTTALDLAA